MNERRSLEVTVGSPITLHCDVCSNPVSHITWYRDGKQLGNGTEYTLDKVTHEDNGNYTCVATNIIGGAVHSRSFNMILSVIDPPSITKHIITIVLPVGIFLLIIPLFLWVRWFIGRKGDNFQYRYIKHGFMYG